MYRQFKLCKRGMLMPAVLVGVLQWDFCSPEAVHSAVFTGRLGELFCDMALLH